MVYRRPTDQEILVLDFLVNISTNLEIPQDWISTLTVRDMDDGGMGSLYLLADSTCDNPDRTFGSQASACRFTDDDGVEVIVSLYLDQFGKLYELDIWKTDFSKLQSFPSDAACLKLTK